MTIHQLFEHEFYSIRLIHVESLLSSTRRYITIIPFCQWQFYAIQSWDMLFSLLVFLLFCGTHFFSFSLEMSVTSVKHACKQYLSDQLWFKTWNRLRGVRISGCFGFPFVERCVRVVKYTLLSWQNVTFCKMDCSIDTANSFSFFAIMWNFLSLSFNCFR